MCQLFASNCTVFQDVAEHFQFGRVRAPADGGDTVMSYHQGGKDQVELLLVLFDLGKGIRFRAGSGRRPLDFALLEDSDTGERGIVVSHLVGHGGQFSQQLFLRDRGQEILREFADAEFHPGVRVLLVREDEGDISLSYPSILDVVRCTMT